MKVNKIFVAFAVLLVCVLGYGFFSSKKGEETKKVDNNTANATKILFTFILIISFYFYL